MDIEQGQSNVKQDQLLEIYKIHVEQANNISNRRTTINRFYQVFLSGLVVIFAATLQNKNGESVKLLSGISIEWIMLVLGGLGMWLTLIWCISVDSNLLQNTRKYETLKILEGKLEYQFLKQEWKFLGLDRDRTYRSLATTEFLAPITFFLFFSVLFGIGVYRLRGGDHPHLRFIGPAILYPLILILIFGLARSLLMGGAISINKKFSKRK